MIMMIMDNDNHDSDNANDDANTNANDDDNNIFIEFDKIHIKIYISYISNIRAFYTFIQLFHLSSRSLVLRFM